MDELGKSSKTRRVDYFTIHAGVLHEHIPLYQRSFDWHCFTGWFTPCEVDDPSQQTESDVRVLR